MKRGNGQRSEREKEQAREGEQQNESSALSLPVNAFFSGLSSANLAEQTCSGSFCVSSGFLKCHSESVWPRHWGLITIREDAGRGVAHTGHRHPLTSNQINTHRRKDERKNIQAERTMMRILQMD